MSSRQKNHGFTLIEMMIVVAIIGILGAIAMSNYTEYIRRSKLTEATATLSDLRIKMEQFYQDNRNYGTAAACGITMPTTSVKYFAYGCATSASAAGTIAQAFTLTAASAVGVGTAVGDYTYALDQSNVRITTKYKGAVQTGKNCWLITGSEC